MATTSVNGLRISYEVIGPEDGRPWALTPGGRESKDTAGIREMATALSILGHRVLIWDRPNTGASDVCFEGETESEMQADVLAELLRSLDMTPAVIAGGSGGSRISLLTAVRHPDVAAACAMWWITGGTVGLLATGTYYCSATIRTAWKSGMEAVAALPDWQDSVTRNPDNRQRILAQDRSTFIATMERWLQAYCPTPGVLVPGLTDEDAAKFDLPTLVFRSGAADISHRRETSEHIASVLPQAQLVEPPWGDNEWAERQAARDSGEAAGLFVRWPLLVPQLHSWATEVLG